MQEPGLLLLRNLCRRCHAERVADERLRAGDDGREPGAVGYLGVAEFRRRMALDVGLRYPELDGFGEALGAAWRRVQRLDEMIERGERARLQFAARSRLAA